MFYYYSDCYLFILLLFINDFVWHASMLRCSVCDLLCALGFWLYLSKWPIAHDFLCAHTLPLYFFVKIKTTSTSNSWGHACRSLWCTKLSHRYFCTDDFFCPNGGACKRTCIFFPKISPWAVIVLHWNFLKHWLHEKLQSLYINIWFAGEFTEGSESCYYLFSARDAQLKVKRFSFEETYVTVTLWT